MKSNRALAALMTANYCLVVCVRTAGAVGRADQRVDVCFVFAMRAFAALR